jgi:hypothetical protein
MLNLVLNALIAITIIVVAFISVLSAISALKTAFTLLKKKVIVKATS